MLAMTEMHLYGRGILSIRQLQTLATLSSGILERRENYSLTNIEM